MAAPRARASASAGERQDHRGCAEDAFVRSSPGDAVDCTRFRLVWADSAWSCSPRSMGAKRDRRSAYWLWAGAAAAVAGEARERFVWVAFGLILLAAWAKTDSWRLTGCGQELQWLKLERPEEARRLGRHKKFGGDTAGTADAN
ncbi:uncharacterized protein LOC128145747 isoform X7 [Harpia harpyja]|uniref:uncharacterized protein LOC128145747 isoform X7 n=1 Tax=Harpia harpyja TaxID=202280 RepID=UPI0022B21486|nr:uncharacterized protein LOC128145747 isoform X7 [Harpia harpyja]XP_052652322.1 uncharacterized protein LOC128145747 isoform X7 [Harpia harpyja]